MKPPSQTSGAAPFQPMPPLPPVIISYDCITGRMRKLTQFLQVPEKGPPSPSWTPHVPIPPTPPSVILSYDGKQQNKNKPTQFLYVQKVRKWGPTSSKLTSGDPPPIPIPPKVI